MKFDDDLYSVVMLKSQVIPLLNKIKDVESRTLLDYTSEYIYALGEALGMEYYYIVEVIEKLSKDAINDILKAMTKGNEIEIKFDFPSTYYTIRDFIKENKYEDIK